MSTKAQTAAVRFLPSMTDVAFVMPLVCQFHKLGGAESLLADGDTGWHLRTGEWILSHGRVPQTDMFSYTHVGQPWFAWEWLWDVCFGYLNIHFGLQAVVAATMLVLCLTSALLYRLVLRKCPNPVIAIIVTFVANVGSSIHWLARPHVVTLLFTVVFLDILDRAYAEESTRAVKKMLWLLPALMVLWTNLHGGFVAAFILIGAYVGGGLAEAVLEPAGEARRVLLEKVKPFALCGAWCALATLVNPYFISLHEHIVKYLSDPYFYEHISEFMSFNFAHPASPYIEALMLLAAAAACWNLYHKRFVYFVLLAGWLHLGLNTRRNVPIFSMVCAPLIAQAMVCWLSELPAARVAEWLKSAVRRFDDFAMSFAAIDRLPRVHVVSAGALALVAALLYAPQPPKGFQASQDPKEFPVKAANMLLKTGYDRIFTIDLWGGYLIYRLYPHAEVFIDGRSDFYGAAFELKYLDMLGAKYDWDLNLSKYDAHTVLVPADCGLASALKESHRWHVVYDDQVAIVFRLNSASPLQQVSTCPNQGVGKNCGKPAAAIVTPDVQTPREHAHPKSNFVAEIGPPRLPLLNRP